MGLREDLVAVYDSIKSNALLHESPHFVQKLNWTTIASSVFLTTLVSILITTVYRIYFHPLAHLPGPLVAKVTGLWRSKLYWEGTWHDDIIRIHEQYGRVVRIAPNEVSLVDEYAMKSLYGHGKSAPKTSWYSVWDPPRSAPALFSELDKKHHAYLRKRISAGYSMSSILKYEKYIQGCLDLLLEKLQKYANLGQNVNMSNWTNAFAFDAVGELAYGKQLGHLRTETDVNGLRKGIFGLFYMLSNLGHFPGQAAILNNPLTALLGKISGNVSGFLEFRIWSEAQVRHRLDKIETTEREDLLSHFCNMKDVKGNPAPFNEILVEALNIIGAGADTTSIGMRSCLYYLCLYPRVYHRLQAEVDEYYQKNSLKDPITYLQTQELPYLRAVIKEATRMLPSIVYQLLRYAPQNFHVRGYYIPPNTPVGMSAVSQNRDKDIWGEDANDFNPERWLQSDARTNYLDACNMTFGGSGPRMCIGRNIALVELHKFLAQFIHNFDFELVDPKNPWYITSYWFAYQHNMNMGVRFRPDRVLRKVV